MNGSALKTTQAVAFGVMAFAFCLLVQGAQPIVPTTQSNAAVTLKAIPFPCSWVNPPKEFKILDGTLSILASGGAELYNDCVGPTKSASAPMLLFEPDAEFVLSAALTVDFKHEFDGGFLVIYEDENHWAKLLFEKSYAGSLAVCSVVTNTTSDDTVNTDITAKKDLWTGE